MQQDRTGDSGLVDKDRRFEGAVLTHIIESYPHQMRLSELVMEMTGDAADEGKERIRVEDAVRELRGSGLLFRSDAVYLPTRAAIRAYAIFVEAS